MRKNLTLGGKGGQGAQGGTGGLLGRGRGPWVAQVGPGVQVFFRFLASNITTVNLPEFGTYLKEKHISPSLFSYYLNLVKF